MSKPDSAAGFYGKLPSHGDFLSRRLPRQFIEPWDHWLQGGIEASREQLGKKWLDTFLFSPIWQFGLAAGLCGDEAWAGVLMPSVDKVGRYFPLTLVAKVDGGRLAELFDPACGWFDALSKLALSTLEYEFELPGFDAELERLCPGDFLAGQPAQHEAGLGQTSSAKQAFQFKLENEQETPLAFSQLGDSLRERFLAGCSIWRSTAGDDAKSSLLFCEGLPPLDAYVGFLNGQWPRRGWQFASVALSKPPPVEAVANWHVDSGCQLEQSLPRRASAFSVEFSESAREESAGSAFLDEGGESAQSFGLSVVGLRRKLNEDAILLHGELGLWAVADGMGGHSAGDVASQALVAALARIRPFDDLEYFSEQVASNLQMVNRQLQQLARERGYGHIIGSTIVVLLIKGRQFRYLWAGDSRLYRYRQGDLEQLTLDHSLYNESISQGLLPEDGSLEQGRGNVITRAVGADAQLQIDWGQGEITPGDLFILSSDGLDKELSHADIAGFCRSGSVEDITRALVGEAEKRGGRDNISVIAVKP